MFDIIITLIRAAADVVSGIFYVLFFVAYICIPNAESAARAEIVGWCVVFICIALIFSAVSGIIKKFDEFISDSSNKAK